MDYRKFASKIRNKYPGAYDDMDDRTLARKIVEKYPQYSDVTFDKPSSASIPKRNSILDKPEQLSREGLTLIAKAIPSPIPTGNRVRDVALGTPKVVAETMAETAPSFVSKEAMLLGGAGKFAPHAFRVVKPMANFAGRNVAKLGRAFTGVPEENITALFQKPGLLFSKTKAGAQKIYKKAVNKLGGNKPSTLDEALEAPRKTVRSAFKKLDDGSITPLEALEGRQAIDELIRSGRSGRRLTKLIEQRRKLDLIVKSDKGLANADRVTSATETISPFRNMFPRTANNKAGIFRTAGMLGSGYMGTRENTNPWLAALLTAGFSPLAASGAVASAGAAYKGLKRLAPHLGRIGQASGSLRVNPLHRREVEGN